MKNLRKTAALLATLISATLLIGLTGCDGLEFLIEYKDAVYDISGKVINVRDLETKSTYTTPTSGTVELRKFGETTPVKTVSLNSNGTYSLKEVESGSYLVTFKKASTDAIDWVGIPISVEVAGGDIANLGSFVYKDDLPAGSILLVLAWENRDYDIDSTSYVGTVGSAAMVDKTIDSLGNTVTWERDVVAKVGDDGATTDNVIANGAYPVETTVVENLASGTELRFYAKAYLPATSVTGLDDGDNSVYPSGVKLYAMTDDGAGNPVHFGTWFSPLNSSEAVIGMIQIVGNANGTMTLSTFGGNTPKSIIPLFNYGIPVTELK